MTAASFDLRGKVANKTNNKDGIGLLWIGQGTGAIAWPASSFMINQLQWAGYGALLGAVGLILIWQGKG